MAEKTAIEWCDATFNPWLGCANVSPGCGHCYAKTFAENRMGIDVWFDAPRRVTAPANWRKPLKWAREMPEQLGRRPRVFCASMADVFEELPQLEEPRGRLFDLIRETPELDWLLLTKRPEFARAWLFDYYARAAGGDTWGSPLPNVWVGVSIENSRFTWRAEVLREIPAAVRFISAEPLLGSLFQDSGRRNEVLPSDERASSQAGSNGPSGSPPLRPGRASLSLTGIDWIIVGGESGPKARPFHLEHAREIIRFCRLHRSEWCGGGLSGHTAPSVFVKQLGADPRTDCVVAPGAYAASSDLIEWKLKLRDRKGGDPSEWPEDLRIREFPRSAVLA